MKNLEKFKNLGEILSKAQQKKILGGYGGGNGGSCGKSCNVNAECSGECYDCHKGECLGKA